MKLKIKRNDWLLAELKIKRIFEGVDRGGGGTGIEGAESGVEGAESGVEGAGSGSRGGGKRGNCGRGSGKIGGRTCFFFTRKFIKNDS